MQHDSQLDDLLGASVTATDAEGRFASGRVVAAWVAGGSIRFHPTAADSKSKPSGGVIGADGSYSVPDAPIGACKVTVDTGLAKGAATKNEPKGPGADVMKKMQGPPAGMPAMGGGNGAGFVSGTKPIAIEAAYASAATTPLTAEVKRGANTHNFEVK